MMVCLDAPSSGRACMHGRSPRVSLAPWLYYSQQSCIALDGHRSMHGRVVRTMMPEKGCSRLLRTHPNK